METIVGFSTPKKALKKLYDEGYIRRHSGCDDEWLKLELHTKSDEENKKDG